MSCGAQIASSKAVQRTGRALQSSRPTGRQLASFVCPQHYSPLCHGQQKLIGRQQLIRPLTGRVSLSRTFYSTRQRAAAHTQALPATLLVGLLVLLLFELRSNHVGGAKLYMFAQSIALTDESPAWTLDQIAGLVFGVGSQLYMLARQ